MIQILYVKHHVPLTPKLDVLLDLHAMPQEMLVKQQKIKELKKKKKIKAKKMMMMVMKVITLKFMESSV
jgi:hypothetical protein